MTMHKVLEQTNQNLNAKPLIQKNNKTTKELIFGKNLKLQQGSPHIQPEEFLYQNQLK
jgi:hypothetical protein